MQSVFTVVKPAKSSFYAIIEISNKNRVRFGVKSGQIQAVSVIVLLYEHTRQLMAARYIWQYFKAPESICLAAGAAFFSQASLQFQTKPLISLDIIMSLCSS